MNASLAAVRVVVITDRRQLAGEEIAGRLAAIFAAVPRGSVLVQVREKDLDGGPLLRLVREVIDVAAPAGAPVWVNDRADVALAAGADGVHLPEHGLAIADARLGSLRVGCSRHDAAGVRAAVASGADLVQLGPIWETPGKAAPIGIEALRIRGELPAQVRLVAVGGIASSERARLAAEAGADAVAVIRAAWTAADPSRAIADMVHAVEQACLVRVTMTL